MAESAAISRARLSRQQSAHDMRSWRSVLRIVIVGSCCLLIPTELLAQGGRGFGGNGYGGGGYGGYGQGGNGYGRTPGAGSPNAPGGNLPGPQSREPRYKAQQFAPVGPQIPVVGVRIVGNGNIDQDKITRHIQTRKGRTFDPEVIQADVRRLTATGMFRDVRTYKDENAKGVVVTYEFFPLPTIEYIRFQGEYKTGEKKLAKQAGLEVGESLHRYRVEEARRNLEEFYFERGFNDAKVAIQEGDTADARGVTFLVNEGKRQRIFRTNFEGNTIVPDGLLKAKIESKPGILWVLKGKVNEDQIREDENRLTSYYRSLGYFRTSVKAQMQWNASQEWVTINFQIDEGERYRVRNVAVVGNQVFQTNDLAQRIELKSGDFFDARKMNRDVSGLRDIYGSQGYIYADVNADPRFLEEPGLIDLVYDINEGDQYRVNQVIVNIEGDFPHTRRNVVLNRLDLAPGDVIDIRKIRDSERRLKSSQLFVADPMRGPSIAVKPPELGEGRAIANRPKRQSSPTSRFRGQSPDFETKTKSAARPQRSLH